MADERPYREQVAEGKEIAIAFVRQKVAELQVPADAVRWVDHDFHSNTHALEVEARGKHFGMEYREEDLADAPATPEVRGRLQRKAESIAREILRTAVPER